MGQCGRVRDCHVIRRTATSIAYVLVNSPTGRRQMVCGDVEGYPGAEGGAGAQIPRSLSSIQWAQRPALRPRRP